jgi:peptidyl-tRNA hydrolase, PTH2 family
MGEHKMAVVVVRSLRMGVGKTAAQVGHACVTAALRAKEYDPQGLRRWLDEGQMKIVLRVDSQKELYPLKAHAQDLGLTTALITDAGHTQLEPGTVTCLAIGPAQSTTLDQVVGDLKLL